jgi:hypothetical protein
MIYERLIELILQDREYDIYMGNENLTTAGIHTYFMCMYIMYIKIFLSMEFPVKLRMNRKINL